MKRAIIIGGGPGGLSAALGVRRAGFEPIVCEATPLNREVGSGLTLWPNAISALDVLPPTSIGSTSNSEVRFPIGSAQVKCFLGFIGG